MLNKTGLLVLATATTIFTVIGCGPQAQNDINNADEHVASAAKTAGKSFDNATANTRKVLSNDETSAGVKQALLSAKDLNTSNLAVDTDQMKVTLHGSVPSADQKKRADVIAKAVVGPTYKVDDQLSVGAPKT